jgi:hypothetical protein
VLGVQGRAQEQLPGDRAGGLSEMMTSALSLMAGLRSAWTVSTSLSTFRSTVSGSTPGRSNLTQTAPSSRQASMGMAAAGCWVPLKSCWVTRSSSRKGSVRISTVIASFELSAVGAFNLDGSYIARSIHLDKRRLNFLEVVAARVSHEWSGSLLVPGRARRDQKLGPAGMRDGEARVRLVPCRSAA